MFHKINIARFKILAESDDDDHPHPHVADRITYWATILIDEDAQEHFSRLMAYFLDVRPSECSEFCVLLYADYDYFRLGTDMVDSALNGKLTLPSHL